jgi:flagellar FliJ protein
MSNGANTALDLAIDQASEKHTASEKALAYARTRLSAAESTYATLHGFRGEYAQRLRGINAFSKDALGNYHRFLGKLSLALDNQQKDRDQAAQTVEQRTQEWFATLQRVKAMELLRNRRAAALEQQLKRQEQKQSDEFAARSARLTRLASAARRPRHYD